MISIERIVTHNDFDGLASAAICMSVFDVDRVLFAGPSTIIERRISIGAHDVVCDLPYPIECGMWFDHHEGNLNDLKLRGYDPDKIPGKFAPEKSCARVVHTYFSREYEMPDDFKVLVEEADRIDSFDYKSIEEWRCITPAHIINDAIKARCRDFGEKNRYLARIVEGLCDTSLEEVAEEHFVRELYHSYREEEDRMLNLIEQNSSFHPHDPNHEIVVVDLTNMKWPPFVIKNLAFIKYPDALAVLQIQNLYHNNVKTNNVSISVSLSVKMNNRDHCKDLGEIMRSLNIGDGHGGAASGNVSASNKSELEKKKEEVLLKIFAMWKNQSISKCNE